MGVCQKITVYRAYHERLKIYPIQYILTGCPHEVTLYDLAASIHHVILPIAELLLPSACAAVSRYPEPLPNLCQNGTVFTRRRTLDGISISRRAILSTTYYQLIHSWPVRVLPTCGAAADFRYAPLPFACAPNKSEAHSFPLSNRKSHDRFH
jgi:hypothetical protein